MYSTYLGGSDYDAASSLAVIDVGRIYVAGGTKSAGFPLPASVPRGEDAFLLKLDMTKAGAQSLINATLYGGSGDDEATGLAVGPSNSAYICGVTDSADLPTQNASQPSIGGGRDLFVARFLDVQTGAQPLAFGTYLGGSGNDDNNDDVAGIAVSGCGDANVVGTSDSSDFPVTACGYQQTMRGVRDAVICRLDTGASCVSGFCFGDSSLSTPCPCGNAGLTGHGCDNSLHTGGAVLSAVGQASLASDTLVLTSSGELPNALSIFLQGDNNTPNGAVFGDGVRCVGGNLKRLYVENAVGGLVTAPTSGDPSISNQSALLGDSITSGATRYYQVYYRDPDLAFCPTPPGNSWNVSSGLVVVWE
jgi:hypothetical protein